MKHFLFLTLTIMFLVEGASYSQSYQETYKVQMEKDANGLNMIPCEVNGLRMKFILDTGASIVSVSLEDADFMLRHGYLKNNEILNKIQLGLADGSIVEGAIVNLASIKIGPSFWLENVKAVVMLHQDAPLLLGQTVLSELGTYSINPSNNTFTFQPKPLEQKVLDATDDAVAEATAKYKLVGDAVMDYGTSEFNSFVSENHLYYLRAESGKKIYKSGSDILSIANGMLDEWTYTSATITCTPNSIGAFDWLFTEVAKENNQFIKIGDELKTSFFPNTSSYTTTARVCQVYQQVFEYNAKVVVEICFDGMKTVLTYGFLSR